MVKSKVNPQEFPTKAYRVSLSSFNQAGELKATVTPLPARITAQLVITANKRRIKMDRVDKVEFIADSNTHMVARLYTLSENLIPELINEMLLTMRKRADSKLRTVQELNRQLEGVPAIRIRDWEE